jgi:hypothetical protein
MKEPRSQVYEKHAEDTADIACSPQELFEFLDDHRNLSLHMNSGNGSPMMGGGQMKLVLGEDAGKRVGAHVIMRGRAFGFDLYLDEVVTERVPAQTKIWQTVHVDLVVIGAYELGFRIHPRDSGSRLTVWIDYDLPDRRKWLGRLGGPAYAGWCVRQMMRSAVSHCGRPA